ncbi:Zinc-type alcohol dehydrogenase-like protein [Polaromonas vacuolata]|uniref:Zinc-type alcohol dehydrogenase-like protein n=1 Tax=Polaromonas vacuolata TaxID=37448 RepID=A0A6H2H5C3_9BURK|nr:zinc-binding alcohol dehydrogenase family protein [Polaromonas vacuolata]QJC55003.1 Zinc-type alcohol dehydrogenase-like protein [Polaromonas vacuolata]
MKAVAYQKSLPISQADSLQDITLADPVPGARDLLVEVRAVSVNPVDTKIRQSAAAEAGEWKVLGWDVAGVVRAVGAGVSGFKAGDRVWYAGSIARQGSNSELHVVDERIVGKMPTSLDFAQAAALPLTAITAWEMLFDRLGIVPGKQPSNASLLIVGAAGGVGSIMLQLARRLTALTVIGTASRPETKAWVKQLGAHHVIDHSLSFADELKRIGIPQVEYVVSLTQTEAHFAELAAVIAPQGKFGLIDDPKALDITLLKAKSISLHWELMFTRSLFSTDDMAGQGRLLSELAELVDSGLIQTTLGENFGRINASNLKRAHALLESGKSRGKIVLEGF